MDITLFLIGPDEDTAQENVPFQDAESAENYIFDNHFGDGWNLYTVAATINFSTIDLVEENMYPMNEDELPV